MLRPSRVRPILATLSKNVPKVGRNDASQPYPQGRDNRSLREHLSWSETQ